MTNPKEASNRKSSNTWKNILITTFIIIGIYFALPILFIIPCRLLPKSTHKYLHTLFEPIDCFRKNVPGYESYLMFQIELFQSIDEKPHEVTGDNSKSGWPFTADGEIFSLPATDQEYLYFGSSDGCFYKVNKLSGSIEWKATGFGSICSNPLIIDNTVYFTAVNSRLYALSTVNGKILWKEWVRGSGYSNPKFIEGNIHLMGDERLEVLAPTNGKFIQRIEFEYDGRDFDYVGKSSMIITSNNYECNNHQGKGKVYRYNKAGESFSWQLDQKGVIGKLVCDKTKCYYGTREGIFYAIDQKTGHKSWQINCKPILKSTLPRGEYCPVWASNFALETENNIIFDISHQNISNPGALICASKSTGKIIWTINHPSSISGSFIRKGNYIIAMTQDRKILTVQIDSGKSKLISKLPPMMRGEFTGIVDVDNYLYISGGDKHIWRIPISDVIPSL